MLVAADGGGGGTPIWLTLLVALLAAAGPLLVARQTGARLTRAEEAARLAEAERDRLRLLEERVQARKREIYEPFLGFLGEAIDPRTRPQAVASGSNELIEFGKWVSVFGSDEAVTAFSRFMQSTYADAPVPILMRLYADFLLAARRDLGDDRTKVTRLEVLAIRLRDAYGSAELHPAMELSLEELCERHDWVAPWTVQPPG